MGCLGGGENGADSLENNQACMEQANHVEITKHKCRDIGLPDAMGVPNRKAAPARLHFTGHN